jgi:hypothetical protein
LTLFAQQKKRDTTLNSILDLRNGETHTVSITHKKTKTEKGKSPSASTIRYSAILTVIDSTEDEYTFRWVYHFSQEGNPLSPAAGQFIDGLTLTYKTDGMGDFKELQNWEEVRDFYIKVLKESLPPNQQDSASEVLNKTITLFSSKEMVESVFIKEVKLLHSTSGQSYSTKLAKQTLHISTPLTEDPIPAVATSQITAIQPGEFVVTGKQTIDKVASLRMFQQMFKKMGAPDVMADKQAKATLASFQMSDESQFTIRTSNGLPIKAFFKRTGGAEGVVQIETFTLTVE